MSQVDVQISDNLVKPIIEAKIQAAIASVLNEGTGRLVENTVAAVMSQKVDHQGEVGDYRSDITRIEYLSTKMLENAATEAIKKWCVENQKQIEDAMYKELSKKSQTSKLVKVILAGLVESTKSSWRFGVKFTFDND